MSRKVHSSGYPRKFIDKIALIKQKEALTNANFESAIQGLPDISMKHAQVKNDNYLNETNNKIYTNDNINKLRDDYSNTSYSPQSFTSDSTINFQSNDNYQLKETNNDLMKCLYESTNPERNVFHNVPSYGSVKFRHVNDHVNDSEYQQARLSNIEGYRNCKNFSRDLNEQVCSGSLPDVSSFNNQKSINTDSIFNSDRFSNPISYYSENYNRDSINLKEALSNLKKVKKEASSKKALFEHLKNRGLQNHAGNHPHHIQNTETPTNLASILNSQSINRNRSGYVHNYDSTGCAANTNDNGHLKHYSASKSPYLSLPIRDLQCNKDCDNSYRKRHVSGNVIPPQSQWELNLNCQTNVNNNSFKYKSLTPTETLQPSLFNTPNESHLLSPTVFGMISADYRRVASDSSIQKSLKRCTDISQSNFPFNNEENSFGKLHNNKEDSSANMYQKIKSMTSEQTNPELNSFNETQKNLNHQRDISLQFSLLDKYICQNSPDENLDPNLDALITPDKSRQTFKYLDITKSPEQSPKNNSNKCSCSNDGLNASQVIASQQSFNAIACNDNKPNFKAALETQDNNFHGNFAHLPNHNDQCYWTQPTESNQSIYSKEASPKIKPCENLDPQNVSLDLNTDFSYIPDITLNDEDVQRRHSLNMADEVLSNLNIESNNLEFNSIREKGNGLNNFYQLMDTLSEEVSNKNCENEY